MGSKLPIDAITSPHVSIRDGSLLTSITFASDMATPCLGSGEAQIDDIMQRKTTVSVGTGVPPEIAAAGADLREARVIRLGNYLFLQDGSLGVSARRAAR